MCSLPFTINGFEVACRQCDSCCETYKNQWVSRCMAEMAILPHALTFTLTYADKPDGTAPAGAAIFKYRDVQLMWKRLRFYGNKHVKELRKKGENAPDFVLRFVVVGEKGTRFGRCHYHGVMFSNYDLRLYSHFKGARSIGFAYKRRLDWTATDGGMIWPHGFVEFQPATRKGMAYALKYILKGRMSARKSKGHAREGKTEWLAASYLWCSKVPAIGEGWLMGKALELLELGMCFSSLRVRVPSGGDWFISGEMQDRLCRWIHHTNNNHRRMHGKDLSGFSTLLASVAEPIENTETGESTPSKAWELLTNGELSTETAEVEGPAKHGPDTFAEQLFEQQSRTFRANYANRLVAKCCNLEPCSECHANASEAELDAIDQHHYLAFEDWIADGCPNGGSSPILGQRFKTHWQRQSIPSRCCARRNEEWFLGEIQFAKTLIGPTVQSSSR